MEKRVLRHIEVEIYMERNRPIRGGETLSVFYGEKGMVAVSKVSIGPWALFKDILIVSDQDHRLGGQGMELIVLEQVNEDQLYPIYKFRKLNGEEFEGKGWGEEIDLEILGQLGVVVGRDFNNRVPKAVVEYIKEKVGQIKRRESEQD